jgi:cytochrome P450
MSGVPHATSRDDEYKGWHIPKGAIVAGNTLYVRFRLRASVPLSSVFSALLHDPEVFPQPEVFKPERFLRQGKDGLEIDPTIRSPLDSAFGYGRR